MSPPIDRRDFVRLSSVAALAAPTLLGACGDEPEAPAPSLCGTAEPDVGVLWDVEPEAVRLDAELFPLPPQSGAMRATTALIWGYGEGVDALDFWVWRTEGAERYLVHSGTAETADGYAKVALDALAAGQWYQFVWMRSGMMSRCAVRWVDFARRSSPAAGSAWWSLRRPAPTAG